MPEKTDGRQGFIHPMEAWATVDFQGQLDLIIRDHDRRAFKLRKILSKALLMVTTAYPAQLLALEQN